MVGTKLTHCTRLASIRRKHSSASNLTRPVTRPPWNSAVCEAMKGALWYSGPGLSREAPSGMPTAAGPAVSITAGR